MINYCNFIQYFFISEFVILLDADSFVHPCKLVFFTSFVNNISVCQCLTVYWGYSYNTIVKILPLCKPPVIY